MSPPSVPPYLLRPGGVVSYFVPPPVGRLYCTKKGTVCTLTKEPKLVLIICILFGTFLIDRNHFILYTLWYIDKGSDSIPVSYSKLFLLLEQRGIKKIDLRNKYGFNPKTVNSLTKNKSVTVDTIMALCEILLCQPGDIMEYVPDINQTT